MPVDAARQRRGIELVSDRLLLVEGKDEVNLFEALIRRSLVDGPDIQVIDVGGKDKNFRRNLMAIRTAAPLRPTLRAIGVVRDADDDAGGAFESVHDSIRDVGYVPPASHGQFSDALPAVGVFIVPDGTEQGAIETICRRSVGTDETAKCVDGYLKCLADHDAMYSRNPDKSFAHAYLAAMKDPMARVGEGASQGVWNFASPAFAELSGFLRRLADEATPSQSTTGPARH